MRNKNTYRLLPLLLALLALLGGTLAPCGYAEGTAGFALIGEAAILTPEEYRAIFYGRRPWELTPDSLWINGEAAHYSAADGWWLCTVSEGANPLSLSAKAAGLPGNCRLAMSSSDCELAAAGEGALRILLYNEENYAFCRVYLTTLSIFTLDAEGTLGREDIPANFSGRSGQVHLRGASTYYYDKGGYKLTLDKKTSFLDMRKDNEWVLYAAYNDPERVRNVFSSQLWYDCCAGNNDFGLKNGCEFRFIELFLNGRYHGLYALGYKPEQKDFDIRQGEYLVFKTNFGESNFEFRGDLSPENEADALRIWQSKYTDDVRSATDLWLFVNFCAAVDNTAKNYFAALKKGDEGYCAVYCPWDIDLSWGNTWAPEGGNHSDSYGFSFDATCRMDETHLFGCLPIRGEKAELLRERYAELRAGGWSDERLTDYIDRYEREIFASGAYQRDLRRWPDSSRLSDPSQGLSQFRVYVLARAHWMDEYIASL